MKVHTTDTQQQFKPITLHIEIESQEEFDLLSKLLWYDASVSECVFPSDKVKAGALASLMYSINCSLVRKVDP